MLGAAVSYLLVLPSGGWTVQTYRLLTGGCLVSLPAARRLECPTHCIAARRIPSAVLLLGAAVSCFLLPGGSNLLVLSRGAVVSGLVVLPPGGLSAQTYRLLTGGCLVSLPAA